MILLSGPGLPGPIEVHYMIEGVISTLPKYVYRGYTIVIESFDSNMGKCAIIQDTFGTRFCIVESINRGHGRYDFLFDAGGQREWLSPPVTL